MKQLREFPYRILIVEDEQRDWAEPMQEALKDAARDAGYVKLEMELAENYDEAERSIACRHFQVISMDMRLPGRKNEIVSVETGTKLAKSFPYVGFPKRVIYSITLQEEHVRDHTREAMQVLEISGDRYAKSTGRDHDGEEAGVAVLKVADWASLVVDSLAENARNRDHPGEQKSEPPLTVVGAYLHFGPDLLPPLVLLCQTKKIVASDHVGKYNVIC